MKSFHIANREVGEGFPVFVIAELSANHNGSLQQAIATIRAAKKAGADAIKLQTYTADTITLDVQENDFLIQQGGIWDGRYLHALYQEAFTPWEWHAELFRVAGEEGLICFSSPFDRTAVDLLESLDTPAYKIASLEITDIPLIAYVAAKGKPVILSTGIATEEDIRLALDTCRAQGNDQIALLKCTTSYPAPLQEANLVMIPDMKERFGVVAGLSDHTLGSTAPVVATALGASIIEKHFIIDRSEGGPDASFSLDETEFAGMVTAVRQAELTIGTTDYRLTAKQQKGREHARSLYVCCDVRAGETVTAENVRSVRPGYGLHPRFLQQVLGKKFTRDVQKGERMSLALVQ